jgi:ATPase subunit of ABC transporter with duplicated ATPase domains
MSLFAAKNLTLIRSEPLFSGLTFSIAKGDRVGLVAANGRGKSSLLRIIAGEAESTGGTVTRGRGLVVAFAPQDPLERLLPMTFRDAVSDALSPELRETESWRVDILLDDLAVDEATRDRPVRTLSGGWQRTMLLARAAVVEPDLILLDEPTNHLDLGRIGVLQRFLAALPRDCAMIAASHDRAFLDDVTGRTLFLRPEHSEDFSLPYARALQALEERDLARGRRHENDMRKVRALRQQAAKLKNIGVNSGSDLLVVKTKQLSEWADRLEEQARPAHLERSAGAIRLTNSGTHAKALVAIDEAAIAAPDGRLLFRTGRLWIENGDRVALLGANGTGKTRFVERLRAALGGGDPQMRGAASLRLGHSDQSLSRLDGFATPWDAVKRSSEVTDHQARSQLAGAGIGIDAQAAPLSRLSGGQRARLAMLLLRLSQPNFYLLDEPTNHLDIEGQDMLEGELVEHGAACLLVSHDRAFVKAVATRFWVICNQRLIEVDDPTPVFQRLLAG